MIGTFDTERREVTVVGAGISGMLAAYALDKKGYRVTLVEERGHGGGLIQTEHTPYGIAERAAHSLLATPEVFDFCAELGVELAEVRKDSRARYIVRDGRLRKFPLTATEAAGALRRAAFARGENHLDEQDLEVWGRRHLGAGAVDYLLTPMVRGIYGVEPAELGLTAAFPELAVEPGRTLLGTLLGRAFRGKPKAAGARPRPSKRMVAPRYGMGDVTARLERVLEERLGARFHRGVRLDELPDAPNVLLATPAYVTARLVGREAPELARALAEVRYTPIVSTTAFVSRDALTRPVKGVGALIPAREGRAALGVLFTSSSFEGRVTDEGRYVSFAVLLGGTSQPHWIEATDEELRRAVCGELSELLGVRGEPLELVISRWPRAIPQYSTALPRVWERARATWCATPGRLLFGNYAGQVSLRGMIETAARVG